MLVLGWHGSWSALEGDLAPNATFHDAAAVLLDDGIVIAAIEEERLSRVKHTNYFPARAIRHCLSKAGATINDLDAIALGFAESSLDRAASSEMWNSSEAAWKSGRELLGAVFEREFRVDVRDRLHFCAHHLAHLYASWHSSGFSDALAVCLDGRGDGFSGLIAACQGKRISVLRRIVDAQSLGYFYVWATKFLGYRRFDEYKVMGLAPYGDPEIFRELFNEICELLPNGEFRIKSDIEKSRIVADAGLSRHIRRKGDALLQVHKDFAAALQAALERAVFHLLHHYQKATGARRLCLGGGVAHNCTMNGKILRSGLFAEVYVQPAAHDAGNALGAALSVYRSHNVLIPSTVLPHLYWGSDIGGSASVAEILNRWTSLVRVTPSSDVCALAAGLLANGKVLGWVQGRSEFGPRALGNRSILADPRPAENKTRINEMVKKREGYRPFAPAVLQERLHEFFELPSEVAAVPFMIFAVPVRAVQRSKLGAVTHIDGSARVQSVCPRTNTRFHELICAFDRLTGVPILLNTSFNNNCEPIVESVDDAMACFLTTDIDCLVVGDFLVEKSFAACSLDAICLGLVPEVPRSYRLTRQKARDGGHQAALEFTGSGLLARKLIPISALAFRILTNDGRGDALNQRCDAIGVAAARDLSAIGKEFYELWTQRAVCLTPAEP
jgi:carbamoyltransferase